MDDRGDYEAGSRDDEDYEAGSNVPSDYSGSGGDDYPDDDGGTSDVRTGSDTGNGDAEFVRDAQEMQGS